MGEVYAKIGNGTNIDFKAGVDSLMEPDFPKDTDAIPAEVFYVIYTVLFLVGILGNSMLAFIIGNHKKMRTVPNLYILNLSVANLVEIFSSILSWVMKDRVMALCVVGQASRGAAVCAAVYTLAALSSERYHAIAFPLRRDTDMAGTAAVLVAIWTLSIIFGTGDQLFSNCTQCDSSILHFNPKVPYFEFLLTFLLPLLMICLCYVLMAREIYLSSRNLPEKGKHSIHLERLMHIKKKMTWVVLGLVLIFVLSFFPYYAVRLLLSLHVVEGDGWTNCARILYIITFLHCCMNPFILYAFSESGRKQFKHYFLFCLYKTANPLVDDNPSCTEENTRDETLPKEKRLLETAM